MQIDKLPDIPFHSELSSEGRSQLASASREVVLAPMTRVIERGDEVAGAYIVLSGALRIYYINADGREGTLYWVDSGQTCILALNCVFSGLSYPAWVESDDCETHVAVINGPGYRELFQKEPAVQKFTFEAQTVRLFELMELLQETASLGLEQRVAAVLLRRTKSDEVMETTHDKIARHVGSSREVVSRVLRNIARTGAIELLKGRIRILDAEKLQAMLY